MTCSGYGSATSVLKSSVADAVDRRGLEGLGDRVPAEFVEAFGHRADRSRA